MRSAVDARRLAATGVLFDLDGTLVDSRVPVARSLSHALAAHDRPPRTDAELHRWIGAPIHDIIRGLFGGHAASDAEVDSGVASFRERYAVKSLTETTVHAGIPEALARLAKRATLVVATTKPQPHAAKLIDALGLAPYFEAVVGPSLDARSEDKSITLERAIDALAGKERLAMVGDTAYDVRAAHAHGIPCVAVTWGVGTAQEMKAAGADELVETPDELEAVLGG